MQLARKDRTVGVCLALNCRRVCLHSMTYFWSELRSIKKTVVFLVMPSSQVVRSQRRSTRGKQALALPLSY